MNEKTLTLLNTSVLTGYGTYLFEPLTLVEARQLVREFAQPGEEIQSAIGHQSTAELLSLLLEFPVAVNRLEFNQTLDDVALIFKLKQRITEGKVLSREELEAIGYEFGKLTRIA